MSKSQWKQDINVLKFYKEKQNGFFVEIGANDGITLSNTYLLETEYNWKGICVEAIPNLFKKLIINRPNSLCCDKAVYNESNKEVIFDIAECSLLSGISKNIDKHKEKVDLNKTIIQVNTISLNDLLHKYNAPKFIEYLSLDTEGSEYEILKMFDFNNHIFGFIDVEHNFVEPRRTLIKKLLTDNGYVFMNSNYCDDCYKHHSIS